ncbi:MAG: PKD domain-containing protein [Bacteroidetes bacterium]|nr:PKD domain-containing protein [Bacteroidota bacterium]
MRKWIGYAGTTTFLFLISLSGTAFAQSDVFLSVAGKNVKSENGDKTHRFDYWIRPNSDASDAFIQLFDAGIAGASDLLEDGPNTQTEFELFPFDALYELNGTDLVPRASDSKPSVILSAGAESKYSNRWVNFAPVKGHGNGYILRVKAEAGDDINNFKIIVTEKEGQFTQSSRWQVLSSDLSVTVFNLNQRDEIQFQPAFDSEFEPPQLELVGRDDSKIYIKDYFGQAFEVGKDPVNWNAEQFGIQNQWGITITGSDDQANTLGIYGIGKPVLWNLNFISTAILSKPKVNIASQTVEDCFSMYFALEVPPDQLSTKNKAAFIYGENQFVEGGSATINFGNPGSYPVNVIFPTQKVYFPQYWTYSTSVTFRERPNAVIVSDKDNVAPSEPIKFSAITPQGKANDGLRYMWFVNDQLRKTDVKFDFSSIIPGVYQVKLVVSGENTNSSCASDTASKQIIVNSQPYTEITGVEKFAQREEVKFSAKNAEDQDGQPLTYLWSGTGIVSSDAQPEVTLKHEKNGNFEISLTVSDPINASNSHFKATFKYKVNAPPTPIFDLIEMASTDQKIGLNSEKTIDPDNKSLKVDWLISDGRTLTGSVNTVTFPKPGIYTVTLRVDDGEGCSNSVQTLERTLVVNHPPVPVILAKAKDFSATQFFNADSSKDADQGIFTYTWDFGDGTKDIGNRVTHVYQKPGTYLVSLTVDDGQRMANSIQTSTHTIQINDLPVAVITAPDKHDPANNLEVSAEKSVDSDGKITSYEWLLNGAVFSNEAKASTPLSTPGDHVLTLKVKDDSNFDQAVTVVSKKVHVNESPLPKVTFSPKVADPETPVEFDATGSVDPDGKIKNFRWTFSDGVVMTGEKVTKKFSRPGYEKFSLSVDDGEGFSNSVMLLPDQVVLINTAPKIVTKRMIKSNARRVQLDASPSTDADGQELKFLWTFPDGGKSEKPAVQWYAPEGGTYKLAIQVDDQQKRPNSIQSDTVLVTVNRPPVAIIDSFLVVKAGRQIQFDASKSYDPDGDPVKVKWNFGTGVSAEGLQAQTLFTKPGFYMVTAELTDGFTSQPVISSVAVEVQNYPVASMGFSDTTAFIGKSFFFNGTASEYQSGKITYYEWDFGNGDKAYGPNVAYAFKTTGKYVVTLTVKGGDAGIEQPLSQISGTVKVLDGPVAVIKCPDWVSPDEPVRIDGAPSLSPVTITSFQWKIKSLTDSVLYTGPVVNHTFTRTGKYLVSLMITNGDQTNNTAHSEKVITVNARPQPAWVVPEQIGEGDPLVLDARQSVDPDGIITLFEWKLNGKVIGTDPFILVPSPRFGKYDLELKVYDNSTTTTKTAVLTQSLAVNAAPLPKIVLPLPVYENEPVVLKAADVKDRDGDDLKTTWKLDGLTVTDPSLKLAQGTYKLLLLQDDGRGLSNSADSIEQLIVVKPSPYITIKAPEIVSQGTILTSEQFFLPEFAGFHSAGKVQSVWIADTLGPRTIRVVWKPRNEILKQENFPVEVWEALAFKSAENTRLEAEWNPANPYLILDAPEINRPEEKNVIYEWFNGGKSVGYGQSISVKIQQGENQFTLRVKDKDIYGGTPAETIYTVIAK